MKEKHTIHPVYNKDSEILILGSFPSVASRDGNFFYHHPQNRFWKVLATVFDADIPETVEDKKEFLLEHHIAVWDVIESCTISGSSDSSIKDVTSNDIQSLLEITNIKAIYTNGGLATKLYKKHIEPITKMPSIALPSTSPANAKFRIPDLVKAWSVIVLENE